MPTLYLRGQNDNKFDFCSMYVSQKKLSRQVCTKIKRRSIKMSNVKFVMSVKSLGSELIMYLYYCGLKCN